MAEVEGRLKALEEWRHKLDVDLAVANNNNENVLKRLDKIDGHISRLVWLIIAAILGGFLTFVMNGGLSAVG